MYLNRLNYRQLISVYVIRVIVRNALLTVTRVFTARSSYASAVLEIVILPVCLSITGVFCDETKEHTVDILISYERVISLVF